ncbi:MAG: zinc metallopeptidase [Anaerolineales bacterium]|nr:zinc metallopeptidase [Anaerolineales bacterium]
MFLWSTTYFLYMIPAFLLVMLAQIWVNSTYRKWSQVRNLNNISGAEAAKRLLGFGGLYEVELEAAPGRLGDHYDPRSRKLRLSPGVAQGQSVASLAIAAHEIGHAVQDNEAYAPLRFRAALVPAVNLGSRLGLILLIIGLFLGGTLGTQMAWIGVAAFGLGAVFALATLPVELNASARARTLLTDSGFIRSEEEQRGVNAVLNAAAFTYVAALAAAILQLLYWVSLVGGMGGRRRS